ncbi:MAG: YqiA/YcfP family alpha/beta fold hydrolase [Pseudomonadales bacterium]
MQQGLEFVRRISELNGDRKITLTGHSLGGAIAQYVAAELGVVAVAFNPAPIAPSLVRAGKISLLNYGDITTFRGKEDVLTAASGLLDIGPDAITVENTETISYFHDGGIVLPYQPPQFNHDMGIIATSMASVALVYDILQ